MHIARAESIDYERARALYREALALFEEMGAEIYAGIIDERLRSLHAKSYAVTLAHEKVTQELAQAGRIQESSFLRISPKSPDGTSQPCCNQPARLPVISTTS